MPKNKTSAKKKGRYSKAFTDEQSNAIVSAYKSGKTLEELAAQYKCSTSKVRKVLLTKKVSMRPRGPKGDGAKAKTKKVAKAKTKKVAKAKSPKKTVKVAAKVEKENPALVKKGKRELTPAQREAKNARDRARRAAKKSGLNNALASVASKDASALNGQA